MSSMNMSPIEMLRHHVTGAIERGEKQPIVEVPVSQGETRFRRVIMAIQDVGVRFDVVGYHLHDSSWAVVNRLRTGWAVYHVPTGLKVRDVDSLKHGKNLAVTLRDSHPELPALSALPFGVAPSASTPAAKAEAIAILTTLNTWRRKQYGPGENH